MKNLGVLIVLALSSVSTYGGIIPTAEDIESKCVKSVSAYFEKQYENFDSKNRCGFEEVVISKALYKGESISVLKVVVEVCGGSEVAETVVDNKTCAVVTSRTLYGD